MRFVKMHGLGNDYVFVDCTTAHVPNPAGMARRISDRHRGVGSDGLILIHPSDVADARMEMYNADGSRGQMCGNGIRCLAKYVFERGLTRSNPMRVETDAGVRELSLELDGDRVTRVRVDMGRPSLDPKDMPCTLDGDRIVERIGTFGRFKFPFTCVSMGNPHTVIFPPIIDEVDLPSAGSAIENAPIFPQRINVHFARVESRSRVTVRTWERGSGLTQACGTGACAVCVAGVLTGRTDRQVTVVLPGGELDIEWAEDDRVLMTGPAVEVFRGEWTAPEQGEK